MDLELSWENKVRQSKRSWRMRDRQRDILQHMFSLTNCTLYPVASKGGALDDTCIYASAWSLGLMCSVLIQSYAVCRVFVVRFVFGP